MSKSAELEKLVTEINKMKVATSKVDPTELEDPNLQRIATKKLKLYTEANRLRLENAQLDKDLLDHVGKQPALKQAIMAHIGALMCW